MKAQVMNRAWEIAKEAVKRFGGKVKEYFGQALRMAWAEIKKGAGIMPKGSSKGKRSGGGVFGKEEPYKLMTYYHKMKGYRASAYEASDAGNGVIDVDYSDNKEWKSENRNTSDVEFTINHGFYTSGSGRVYDHNINWDNVKAVRGQTYDIKGFLRGKGFHWNGERKQWEK